MNNSPSAFLVPEAMKAPDESKRFYTVGIAMFVVAAGLLLARLLLYWLPIENELIADVIFSFLAQIGILFLALFVIYKYAFKMTARGVFAFSNFRKTKWFNCTLAVPLGILGLFITVGVSTFWLVVLMMFGYTPTAAPTEFPAAVNWGVFAVELLITACLPAFCEEFAMRGGFFTTMKKSYKGWTLYLIMAIAFGLFHQHIRQVLYTAVFGGVMAFLVLKTKSIWPAVIVHFINNGLSVFFDYAEHYGWPGGNILSSFYEYIFTNFIQAFGLFVLFIAAYGGILFLINYLNDVKRLKDKRGVILDSGFNHTQNRVVLLGEEDPERVKELDLEKEVYGGKLPEKLYKPSLKDRAFYIGAIVTTAAFTLFSFFFGFFY